MQTTYIVSETYNMVENAFSFRTIVKDICEDIISTVELQGKNRILIK